MSEKTSTLRSFIWAGSDKPPAQVYEVLDGMFAAEDPAFVRGKPWAVAYLRDFPALAWPMILTIFRRSNRTRPCV
jgi:hypothetical protein